MSSLRPIGSGRPFQDVVLSVFHLNDLLSAAGDRLVADLGLTAARWKVLEALDAAGARPVAWLARDLSASRQNIQRIVNDLDRDGFVLLRTNPHHKRAPLVDMTLEGRQALVLAADRSQPWTNYAASLINPEDLAVTLRVLRTIENAIGESEHQRAEKDLT